MREPAWLRSLGALIGAALACGCAGEAEAPASGVTYPNLRPKFESNGRTLAYVANRQSDTVSVLDLDSMTELAAVPVGRDPVDLDGPRHVLVNRARDALYVVLSYPVVADSPHVLANGSGPRPGYVVELARDDLRPLGEQRVAASPGDLALSDDGGTLAVSHYDTVLALKDTPDIDGRRATLALIQSPSGMAGGTAQASSMPVCVAPSTLVYGQNATRLFVACTGEDSLAVVDTTTGGVLSRVPSGDRAANKPYALARDRMATRLALSNQVAGSVVVFSMEDAPRVLATARLGAVPAVPTWLTDSELLVAIQDPSGLARIDAATGSITQTVSYSEGDCRAPSEARPLADGRLFLVCEGDHYRPGAVVRLDPATLEVTARVAVGIYPDRLATLDP